MFLIVFLLFGRFDVCNPWLCFYVNVSICMSRCCLLLIVRNVDISVVNV